MSILKYIDRLKRIDDLIQRKATGNAQEFARRLGISVSVLKENLCEMRALGASIDFCRIRKSYVYREGCKLWVEFESQRVDRDNSLSIKGGNVSEFLFRTIWQDGNTLGLLQHSF